MTYEEELEERTQSQLETGCEDNYADARDSARREMEREWEDRHGGPED